MKTAIVTGITGQDGAYLSKLLLESGYRVVGLTRSYATRYAYGLEYLGINNDIIIEECDLTDISQIINVFKTYQPVEVYNLSAQSSVSMSFKQPIGTVQYNIISVLNQLEAIMLINKDIKFYQASSSEMYGKVNDLPISENSILHPLSPYAISKAAAHWLCVNYRESYGLFVSCGVLFNHESYLRSSNFFIKKVIKESIAIKNGQQDVLKVGNIDIKRDFGYAPKYVEAMYLMMQHETPGDYIVCSGKSITLRTIIEKLFEKLDISLDKLVIDPNLYRPTDIENTYGSNEKAKTELNWKYDIDFEEVIGLLVDEEIKNYPN